jgi:hypothetical protein
MRPRLPVLLCQLTSVNKQANSVPMAPYTGRGEWACYALGAAYRHVDIHGRAHLWPNHNALGARKILSAQPRPVSVSIRAVGRLGPDRQMGRAISCLQKTTRCRF